MSRPVSAVGSRMLNGTRGKLMATNRSRSVKLGRRYSDMAEGFIACEATHPTTGNVCNRDKDHVQHADPQVKQHVASNGVKWPTLHELDPHEGYNDTVLHRM